MADNFFESLRQQIYEQGLTKRVVEEKRQATIMDNLNFAAPALQELQQLLTIYAAELGSLGYDAKTDATDKRVSLVLQWFDGLGLRIDYLRNDVTNGLVRFTRDESGAVRGGEPYFLNKSNWEIEREDAYVRSVIQDFTDEAAQHGGLS